MKKLILLSLWLLLTGVACKTSQPFCKQQCCSVLDIVKTSWIGSGEKPSKLASRKCLNRFTNSFEESLLQCSMSSEIHESDLLFLLGEPDSILPYAHSIFKLGKDFKSVEMSAKTTLCYRCESERMYLNEKDTLSAATRTYYFLIDAKSRKFNSVFSTGLK